MGDTLQCSPELAPWAKVWDGSSNSPADLLATGRSHALLCILGALGAVYRPQAHRTPAALVGLSGPLLVFARRPDVVMVERLRLCEGSARGPCLFQLRRPWGASGGGADGRALCGQPASLSSLFPPKPPGKTIPTRQKPGEAAELEKPVLGREGGRALPRRQGRCRELFSPARRPLASQGGPSEVPSPGGRLLPRPPEQRPLQGPGAPGGRWEGTVPAPAGRGGAKGPRALGQSQAWGRISAWGPQGGVGAGAERPRGAQLCRRRASGRPRVAFPPRGRRARARLPGAHRVCPARHGRAGRALSVPDCFFH